MPLLQSDYKAPRWLPGAHLQTIVPARFFPRPDVQYRREIVDMPDGDFIVLDWSEPRRCWCISMDWRVILTAITQKR